MDGEKFVCMLSHTPHRARELNSSQMVGAGVAHLAYCGTFWIGNQLKNVAWDKMPSKGTKLM